MRRNKKGFSVSNSDFFYKTEDLNKAVYRAFVRWGCHCCHWCCDGLKTKSTPWHSTRLGIWQWKNSSKQIVSKSQSRACLMLQSKWFQFVVTKHWIFPIQCFMIVNKYSIFTNWFSNLHGLCTGHSSRASLFLAHSHLQERVSSGRDVQPGTWRTTGPCPAGLCSSPQNQPRCTSQTRHSVWSWRVKSIKLGCINRWSWWISRDYLLIFLYILVVGFLKWN